MKLIPVRPQSQWYPKPMIMGCEGVAASMLLGGAVAPEKLMKYWPKHDSNPEKGYVGHPSFISLNSHQTIFPSAFVPYLKQFDARIVDGTGATLPELEKLLDHNQPVLIYHTHLGFTALERIFHTSDGKKHWVSNIHITLLIGYDRNYYYYIDPLWMKIGPILLPALLPSRRQIMKMSKRRFRKSYESPGRLCIFKKEGV
ncbi:C39 family peptidase [Macrococcus bovicus]|uniref:C39 family peptidase n=1 Tax=Macrococcus bovicus TaxID=69968 RepID=UPI0025A64A42|nr:C39 family peptidase [Macrococcus bovicus]WJP98568.1 C39 family peptidase [Macrococcus bovicus]